MFHLFVSINSILLCLRIFTGVNTLNHLYFKYRIVAILLLLANRLLSQPVYFRQYQVEDGLSHNSVICSLQDKMGFLWFGTADGLNRYDGRNFKIFRHDEKDGGSIGSNAIEYLHEDAKGQLWVGTGKGIFLYNVTVEKFTRLPGTRGMSIRAIEDDLDGDIWFSEGGNLYRYNTARKQLLYYPLRNVTAILKAKSGRLWFGTSRGTISVFNKSENSFTTYPLKNTGNSVEKIFDTGEGFLLLGTSKEGVFSFDLKSGRFAPFFDESGKSAGLFVRDINRFSRDDYLFATESGLYRYKISKRVATCIRKNTNNPFAISDNAIYTLCRDRESGMWVGTYFGGINYFSLKGEYFEKFFPQAQSNSIRGNIIREITKDKNGNLWIGTEDEGLNKFDPVNQTFRHFKPGGHGSISHTNIHGLLADGNRLYIGTFENGLDVMDLRTEKVIARYMAGETNTALKSNYINAIFKTNRGEIYVCTSRGLYQFEPTNGQFHLISQLPLNEFYSAIYEDRNRTLWVGTHNSGLFFLDKGNFKRLRVLRNGSDLLQESRILYVLKDSDDYLWVSTEAGLYKIGKNGARKISENDGLPSHLIYTLTEDSLQNIWATTSNGLAKIDRKTGVVQVFQKDDGLLSEQFNHQSLFKDDDTWIYAGSLKGMIRFNPYLHDEIKFTPPIYFTGFQIHNKNITSDSPEAPFHKSILLAPQIKLNHNQSTFSIDFAGLSYSASDKIEFAYKMAGLDNYWTRLSTNRRVYFTNLHPGKYVLSIKSTDTSRQWANNEKQLSIEILPPLWRTNIAYFLYTLTFAGLIYLGFWYYHTRQSEKNQRKMMLFEIAKEKELSASKINFFTRVAHEIRTPLTLIKAPVEKILEQKDSLPQLANYLNSIERNTDRLLSLTNQLLDFRKIESENYPLNLEDTNIPELLRQVFLNFVATAEKKGIELRFSLSNQPTMARVDKEAFTKIVSNLLDNSIKYGFRNVGVNIHTGEEYLTIEFQNDGPPIPPEFHEKIFEPFFRMPDNSKSKGSGIGLALARSLAELHHGALTLVEGADYNKFILSIPFDKNENPAGKNII